MSRNSTERSNKSKRTTYINPPVEENKSTVEATKTTAKPETKKK